MKFLTSLILLALLSPFLALFYFGFDDLNFQSSQFETLAYTIGLSVSVTIISLLLGLIGAYGTCFLNFFGRSVVSKLMLLPLLFPPYIIAYIYREILSPSGFLSKYVKFPQVDFESGYGFIFSLSISLFPYAYLILKVAFVQHGLTFHELGHTLGFSLFKSIRKILIPLSIPALLLGGGIVFIQSMSDWGTASVLSTYTSSISIHELWFGRGTPVAAVQYSLVIVLVFFVFLLLSRRVLKADKFKYLLGVANAKNYNTARKSSVGHLIGVFLLLPITLGFVVPFCSVIYFFIESLGALNLSTLYSDVFTTALLIILVCFTTTLLALYFGYTERRGAGRLMSFATQWIPVAYMIPGIVFVLGILVLTNHNYFLSRYGDFTSFIILFFALTVRYLCFIYIPVKLAFIFLPKRVDELGVALNLSPMRSFIRIHVPQLNRFVVFGSFLIMIQLLKELVVTLSLHPFGLNTLAIRVFTYSTMDMFHESTGFIVAIVILGIYPLLAVDSILSRTREA